MKKIAISCHYDSFENKYKHYGPSILVRDYFTYPILESGGVPIILPNIPYTDLILEKALEGIDGVIIYGGFDIDPIHYGEELTKPVHRYELRDENELALTQYCIKNNIPVFGTCRGMQLINVALGGSLHQDISLANATLIHEMNRDDHSKLAHRVDITNDSLIYKAI
jgi:putative glutamine amidotransferase